jgi:hypothetical protein
MTLKEILAGPNYTPQDLAQVKRPVLVIEGGQDPVNFVLQPSCFRLALWLAEIS